jgi:hypothetical protein
MLSSPCSVFVLLHSGLSGNDFCEDGNRNGKYPNFLDSKPNWHYLLPIFDNWIFLNKNDTGLGSLKPERCKKIFVNMNIY